MDDPTNGLIPRNAVEYCLRKETVNTNPETYKAHKNFIAYMDDPDISQFGRWMHSNGFNCALTSVAVDLDKIPSVTQQILCRECKHYKQDSQGIPYCYKHRGYGWDGDDFCSYAEWEEGEQDG